jgi:hypothetical protein
LTDQNSAQCDRYFQRITELSSYQKTLSASAGTSDSQQFNRNQYNRSSTTSPYKTTGVEEEDEDETLSEYTRVRVYIRGLMRSRGHRKLSPSVPLTGGSASAEHEDHMIGGMEYIPGQGTITLGLSQSTKSS